MMARVDLHLARPIEDTGEQRAVLDRDRVRGIVQDREMTPVDLALWHRQARHIHAQSAAERHVQDLHTATRREPVSYTHLDVYKRQAQVR